MVTFDLSEDEAKLLENYRQVVANGDKFSQGYMQIATMFTAMGQESGDELSKLARQIHPDAMFIWPLYRSCFVVPKQEVTGNMEFIFYHDPAWMGDERTVESLPRYVEHLTAAGSRSGPQIYSGEEELVPYYRVVVTDPADPNHKDNFDYITKFQDLRKLVELIIEGERHGRLVVEEVHNAEQFLINYDKVLEQERRTYMEKALARQTARTGAVSLHVPDESGEQDS